jgi:hypothetical protein
MWGNMTENDCWEDLGVDVLNIDIMLKKLD